MSNFEPICRSIDKDAVETLLTIVRIAKESMLKDMESEDPTVVNMLKPFYEQAVALENAIKNCDSLDTCTLTCYMMENAEAQKQTKKRRKSEYNIFMGECMKTLTDVPAPERMKQCAIRWKKLKKGGEKT